MKSYRVNSNRLVRDKQRFRSLFEILISNTLGDKVTYETDTFDFVEPAKKRKYTPDFKLSDTAYIEAKGIFDSSDRIKMKLMKEQYPNVTFYMLFQNAHKKLSKSSKTSYAMWCEKNGFQWAHMASGIPQEWLENQ